MPRSRKRIDSDNRAIERCKAIISTALKGFAGKHQATAIAERIQGNAVLSRRVEEDRPLLRYLWREGLKIEIRGALAEWDAVSDDAELPPQFELFPDDERRIVRQIGMARIWVPSLGAHVQYHPDAGIPPAQLEEAAEYYSNLSTGLARTAEALLQLAEMRRKRPTADAA